MDKIQTKNNNPTRNATMEFKKTDPVIIVDETKEGVFGNEKFTQPKPEESEDIKAVRAFNRRMVEAFSDCG